MDRLARDLARLFEARIDVPPEIEAAIAGAARARLAETRRRRRRPLRWWAAAAATIALASWLMLRPSTSPSGTVPVPVAGDFDASGRVDILDAFSLARRLDAGTPPPGGDINGDGHIDAQDVEALAERAVELNGQESG